MERNPAAWSFANGDNFQKPPVFVEPYGDVFVRAVGEAGCGMRDADAIALLQAVRTS